MGKKEPTCCCPQLTQGVGSPKATPDPGPDGGHWRHLRGVLGLARDSSSGNGQVTHSCAYSLPTPAGAGLGNPLVVIPSLVWHPSKATLGSPGWSRAEVALGFLPPSLHVPAHCPAPWFPTGPGGSSWEKQLPGVLDLAAFCVCSLPESPHYPPLAKGGRACCTMQ